MPELRAGGRHWEVATGSNLLDALRAEGIAIPYSCRAGSCHACLVRCTQGEVLDALLVDPKLKHLPVVVMTTSAATEEVLNLYRLRCSAFMIKPPDFNEFVRQLRVRSEYWFTVIQRPPHVDCVQAPAF